MIDPLPLRVRLLAAICHLSGMLWMPALLLCVIDFLGSAWGADGNHGELRPAWYVWLLSVLFLLLPMLFWLLTRGVLHDFVDRAAREVINGQLSVLLYCIFLLPFMVMACGIAVAFAERLGIHSSHLEYFLLIGMVIYPAISTVGMIQAFHGNVFRYPWIIHFIGSSDQI
jgi:uncharacterized Tic20 family protein